MKEELTFSEVFISILSAVLFCICIISFDARGHGFFRSLSQSFGISAGFFIVCCACDEDFWKKVDSEEIKEGQTGYEFFKVLEDDENDPWVLEYEAKYGAIEGEKKETNFLPADAVCVNSNSIAIGCDAVAVGSNAIALQEFRIYQEEILPTGKGKASDVENTSITFTPGIDEYIAREEEVLLYERNKSVYHGSCYHDEEGRRFCYDSKKPGYVRVT